MFVQSITPSRTTPSIDADSIRAITDMLQEAFGFEFSLWEGERGELVYRAQQQPAGDELLRAELARRVAQSAGPETIEESDPLLTLAIPLEIASRKFIVAVATFVTRAVGENDSCASLSQTLGCSESDADSWVRSQPIWPADAAIRLARTVSQRWKAERTSRRLSHEVEKLSQNLTSTYEEICLLYGVTQNLRISATDEELARITLEWLSECIPASAVAIQYLPVTSDDEATYKARTEPMLLTAGECPVTCVEFTRLVQSLELSVRSGPLVANENITTGEDWPFPRIRQLIVVPLAEGDNLYGWMAAINHNEEQEFGTVEANLLNSVAAILGIHSGNRELYRQQAEFLANVVRALTSAIDAKDPYTCGHSDRVARISVRLAREMRCNSNKLNTLYMAGLLHDIGKIGIDDNVLRKPGRLTEAEFEHIKLHPELGYKILADLRQLSEVLPIVLHHHEQWDGKGYPAGLAGEDCPFLARVTAVADAFDAMTSDRPYRKGMPVEKVESIFREGSGTQWDPAVIDAYFRCREDIVEISRRERANLSLDVEQWRDEVIR